jgi:hypothetical protein
MNDRSGFRWIMRRSRRDGDGRIEPMLAGSRDVSSAGEEVTDHREEFIEFEIRRRKICSAQLCRLFLEHRITLA